MIVVLLHARQATSFALAGFAIVACRRARCRRRSRGQKKKSLLCGRRLFYQKCRVNQTLAHMVECQGKRLDPPTQGFPISDFALTIERYGRRCRRLPNCNVAFPELREHRLLKLNVSLH